MVQEIQNNKMAGEMGNKKKEEQGKEGNEEKQVTVN
jgi:hypothetical protein